MNCSELFASKAFYYILYIMKYRYIASEPSGKVINGELEAREPAEVLRWMSERGLKPLSVKAIGKVDRKLFKGVFTQSINLEDKVFLSKYLSLMLKVGTDLFKAIDILLADFDKPAVKSLLLDIRDALSKGQPFYSTFSKYPKFFSPVFVNLIKAGEVSGNLDSVFDDLSKNLEKEQAIKNRTKSALVYPIVLIGLSALILFILIAFALPKLSDVFSSGGFEPPLFSKIVFTVGLFLNKTIFITGPIFIIGAIALLLFFTRTASGSRLFWRIITHTPVVGNVIYRISIQRFASTLSSLLKSGMPIIESLEITADAVGSEEMKAAIYRISREGISKGLTIGEAFQRETYFPKVVVNLIAISEKAGHIETILDTLADFYEAEIDTSIKTLLSLLEPLLLVVIGVIVGVIALAIIVPIYQLAGQI